MHKKEYGVCMKQCKKCHKEKPLEEFYKNARQFKEPKVNLDGRSTVCKECTYKQIRANRLKQKEKYKKLGNDWSAKNKEKVSLIHKKYARTPKGVYGIIKKRDCHIEQKEFIDWYEKQEKVCFYCQIPESKMHIVKDNKMRSRLAIDKIEPKLGYRKGNIVLACGICNLVKNNIFTKDEMLQIGKIINNKWKNYEIYK